MLRDFQSEAARLARRLSRVTLEQHFDTFLHTYVPTRGKKDQIQEDNLDSPLVELDLIERVGERAEAAGNQREAIYAFRRERRATINDALFSFCLDEYWRSRHAEDKTLSFRDVSGGHGSPGQVLKMPELDIRERLERISAGPASAFEFLDSAALSQVRRRPNAKQNFLAAVYR